MNTTKYLSIIFFGILTGTLANGQRKQDSLSIHAPAATSAQIFSLLKKGTAVKAIRGKTLEGKSSVLEFLNDNKIYLLDFWFVNCAPCIASIPTLVRLQEKFKNDLVVAGINSFDLQPKRGEKQKQKIVSIIKTNNIKYPLYFTDISVDKKYQVTSYPTIYLIQNGKVLDAHSGYSENSMNELEQIIQKSIVDKSLK